MWIWRGIFGPAERVEAFKREIERRSSSEVGAIVPEHGRNAAVIDTKDAFAMFAVMIRPSVDITLPEGLMFARGELVVKLVNA